MKIGLQTHNFDWSRVQQDIGFRPNEITATSEKTGFSGLRIMGLIFQLGGTFGSINVPVPEAHSTISYLTASTKKVNIGVIGTDNECWYPSILVKIISTSDVPSNDRPYLGIGAGCQVRRETGRLDTTDFSLEERDTRNNNNVSWKHCGRHIRAFVNAQSEERH